MKREISIDALRFSACFAVVCLHVAAPLLTLRIYQADPSAWWTANIVFSLAAWCVPVFVLISGAVNIGSDNNSTAREFFIRRGWFFMRVAFWSLFYVVLRFISEPEFAARDAFISLAKGIPFYHLWFLYMLAGLYLATPFIRTAVRKTSRRSRVIFAFVVLGLASLCTFLRDLFAPNASHMALTLFLPFLGYYVCGFELKDARTQGVSRILLAGLVLTMVVSTAIVARLLLASGPAQAAMNWHYGSFGPLVIIGSIGVFLLARALDAGWLRLPAALSPPTFGVYVLHPLFIPIVADVVDKFNPPPAVAIPVIAIAVFAWSFVTVAALMRIPYLRRLFA